MIAIGVGQSVGLRELEGIATDPDEENVFMVNDFDALPGIVNSLLAKTCNCK